MEIYERIYAAVKEIPYGTVASYSQIGRMVGLKNGARLVGWALRAAGPQTEVPWWRIINAKGQVSIVNPKIPKTEQVRLLEEEGITLEKRDGWFTVGGNFWFQP